MNAKYTHLSYNKNIVHIVYNLCTLIRKMRILHQVCTYDKICAQVHNLHTVHTVHTICTPCAHCEHQVFRVAAQGQSWVLVFPLYPSIHAPCTSLLTRETLKHVFWSKGVPTRCTLADQCPGVHAWVGVSIGSKDVPYPVYQFPWSSAPQCVSGCSCLAVK